MPIITVKTGAHRGALFEMQGDEPCSIGRDKDAHIRILDGGVSRLHAEIYRIGEMFFIRDLSSRNGTYVNEEKIEQEMLRTGDIIRIGASVFLFEDRALLEEEQPRLAPPKARFGPNQDLSSTVILDAMAEEQDLADPMGKPVVARGLGHLQEVARALGEERDIPALLQKVVTIAARAIDADHAYIFVRKDRQRELSLQASYERKGRPTPIVAKSIIRRVLKDGKGILTGDAASDERFMHNPSVIMKGIESVICVPLLALGDNRGVIYLETSAMTHTFEEEDLDLMTTIGIQVGLAMHGILAEKAQERAFMKTVETLVTAMERQDPRAQGHTKRVGSLARRMGKRLRISRAELQRLRLASLLHNVGKIAISREEAAACGGGLGFERLQVERTVELVQHMDGLDDVLPIIRCYRERMDGAGIPLGLAGDQIPLGARILGLADAFDAWLTLGDEEGPCTPHRALQKLQKNLAFDQDLVEVLQGLVEEGDVQFPREMPTPVPPPSHGYLTPPDLPVPPQG